MFCHWVERIAHVHAARWIWYNPSRCLAICVRLITIENEQQEPSLQMGMTVNDPISSLSSDYYTYGPRDVLLWRLHYWLIRLIWRFFQWRIVFWESFGWHDCLNFLIHTQDTRDRLTLSLKSLRSAIPGKCVMWLGGRCKNDSPRCP